ncbi:hypothetical protein NPX13_g3264 [Xylaria arbuscula]|uniref:CHAT domain-containing protein n=1 Tax=Xylaria arbuscula TaxID=114810 RepID=A0A9W8NJ21_9PEZI|nr:hypothetical protein NPX13_g3264 [Xylaria arbuscula]
MAELDHAVQAARECLSTTPADHPDLLGRIDDLGYLLGKKYDCLGGWPDLEEAILVSRAAVDATPDNHPDMPPRLFSLSLALSDKYLKTKAVADLDEAIQACRKAVHATPLNHPQRARRLSMLGKVLRERYFEFPTTALLTEAIRIHWRTFEAAPYDHPDRFMYLYYLGIFLHDRYLGTNLLTDIEEAVKVSWDAVRAIPGDHPHRVLFLVLLIKQLHAKYLKTKELQDLDEVIRVSRDVVEATSGCHQDKPSQLERLARLLSHRCRIEYSETIINETIEVHRRVLDSMSASSPLRAKAEVLSTLGDLFHEKYEKGGRRQEDLDSAIQLARDVLRRTSSNDSNRGRYLNSLGIKLGARFGETGVLSDIELAIRLIQNAIDVKSESEENRKIWLLNSSRLLRDKYYFTRNTHDFQNSVKAIRKLIEASPPGDPDRFGHLKELVRLLNLMHSITGDSPVQDLELLRFAQEVVISIPADQDIEGEPLILLGGWIRERHTVTWDMRDLDEAIRLIREGIRLLPESHTKKAFYLNHLAHALIDKFSRTNEQHTVDEALQLGRVLRGKYFETGEKSDFENAIGLLRDAAGRLPEDTKHKAEASLELAEHLRVRWEQSGVSTDVEEAITCYKAVLDQRNAETMLRIQAGIRGLDLCASASRWELACYMGELAVCLIRRLTPRSLRNTDRQDRLGHIVGLASGSAAVALQAGRSRLAFDLLEEGRGLLISSVEDLRWDVTELRKYHPELASEFIRLREQLDLQPPHLSSFDDLLGQIGPSPNRISQRHDIAAQLDDLVMEVQRLPGYWGFMAPPNDRDVRDAAVLGPIVIVNVSKYRCDAIIVQTSQTTVLPLPLLRSSDVELYIRNNNTGSLEVLEWLWYSIACPVLNFLGFTHPPACGEEWPHVWWIPTGTLTRFPLHAAGLHMSGSADTVIDRVMSSYSLTVKSMIRGRQRCSTHPTYPIPRKAVLVAMETTPGHPRKLPGATREIDFVKSLCSSMGLPTVVPAPEKQSVTSHLTNCAVFHFAGHGHTDPQDPSQSYLLLQDWRSDPLTVSTLLDINLRHNLPFLAYLSACGTGEVKDSRFLDESIHLISACQLAGFRHTIGTLWNVKDETSVEMARLTYESLRNEGLKDEAVCKCLHSATRTLRDSWLKSMAQPERAETGCGDMFQDNAQNGGSGVHEMPRDVVSTNALEDLDACIQHYRAAVDLAPTECPEQAERLFNIGVAQHHRYEITNDIANLETAIQRHIDCLVLTPVDHPSRGTRLQELGTVYSDKYQHTKLPVDLDRAIRTLEEALDALQEGATDRDRCLELAGVVYYFRYLNARVPNDLDVAIRHKRNGLTITPGSHPDRARRHIGLGILYLEKSHVMEPATHLELSVSQFEASLALTPDGHPERFSSLKCLGLVHQARYRETKVIADLSNAVQYFQRALDATPRDHPDLFSQLHNLGISYRDRYEQLHEPSDLESAIRNMQDATKIMPKDHADRAARLYALGTAHLNKSKGSIIQDIDEAIRCFEETLSIIPSDRVDKGSVLYSLGVSHARKYHNLGTVIDLNRSIQLFQESVDESTDDDQDRADRLEYLGSAYHNKYHKTGALDDLELGLQRHNEALRITPLHASTRASKLHHVGMIYRDRYIKTGTTLDLDRAIQNMREAVDVMDNDHPDKPVYLQGLGTGYRDRYHNSGAIVDLEIAIQLYHDALDATSDTHVDRASRLQSLGFGYKEKYQRDDDLADLERSIDLFQKAVDATPEDRPDRADRLHFLGSGYYDIYNGSEELSDLEKALATFQDALRLTPEGHVHYASRFDTLCITHLSVYKKIGAMDNLEAAISMGMKAIDETPEGSPDLAGRLQNSAMSHYYRFLQLQDKKDLEHVIRQLHDALFHQPSFTRARIEAGKMLLSILGEAEDWSSAYQIGLVLVPLISQLTPRSLQNSDKQHFVAKIFGIASDAAAAALMVGKLPYEAVQLLELGRGTIMGSSYDLRTDLSTLSAQYPELAQSYVHHRDLLFAPTMTNYEIDNYPNEERVRQMSDKRHQASQDMDNLIQAIRNMPGFEEFLMPPSERQLKSAAISGPVVIINVSDYRCDALIIESECIKCERLPSLQSSDITARAELLTAAYINRELLEWLWNSIAKPVLSSLGLNESPHDSWPRIWWIPTGPLVKFPIHAAGEYLGDSSQTVLDRVISSYAPSIRGLIEARQNASKVERRPERAVLIGMQELVYALREVDQLAEICNTIPLNVLKPPPTRKQVLEALDKCDIFHFAGHGRINPLDPLRSGLVLRDDILTVADLLEKNLGPHRPVLAYLSACGTGQVKREDLIDESLHLISGCQLAGFQHVIGTLWEANDALCADVSVSAYEWIRRKNMSNDSYSEGLHHAVRDARNAWMSKSENRLRRRASTIDTSDPQRHASSGKEPRDVIGFDDEEESLNWATYVHFGV